MMFFCVFVLGGCIWLSCFFFFVLVAVGIRGMSLLGFFRFLESSFFFFVGVVV